MPVQSKCAKRLQAASDGVAGLMVCETRDDPGLSAEARALGYAVLFKPFHVQELVHAVIQLATQRAFTRCPA